jgi:hypothetical protein
MASIQDISIPNKKRKLSHEGNGKGNHGEGKEGGECNKMME